MLELLGWVSFLLLLISLTPFLLRRLRLWPEGKAWTRNHHRLALACLGVSTLHGVLALDLLRARGARSHLLAQLTSGAVTWLVLLLICLLAISAYKKKTFSRNHCWLAALLILGLALHL